MYLIMFLLDGLIMIINGFVSYVKSNIMYQNVIINTVAMDLKIIGELAGIDYVKHKKIK